MTGQLDELTSSQIERLEKAGHLLLSIAPAKTHFVRDADYHRTRLNFWAVNQSDILPHCIFQPESASDVSLALIIIQKYDCQFAVKSGGHCSFPGSSSTRGILIDLSKLNHIRVADDRLAVNVGPGNRWVDVYTALDPLGLTVMGGRDSDVGAGGLLLGGGMAFLANKYGFSCDNVEAFEVVLADGRIVVATPTEYPDLYKALRGGGNKFGVVTNFKLSAYPEIGMWGGIQVHEYKHVDAMLDAFIKWGVEESDKDPKLSYIINFAPVDGKWLFVNDVQYCAPLVDPEGFKAFRDIPMIEDRAVVRSLAANTLDLTTRSPRHRRNSYWALSTKMSFEIAKFFIETFVEESERLLKEVKNYVPAFDMQIVTRGILRNVSKNGGNVFGLSPDEDAFLLYNPAVSWSDAGDDNKVYRGIQKIIHKTENRARELGVAKPWLYMNYASQFQDVFASYGKDNAQFLANTARKYDPQQIFSNLSGYFGSAGPLASTPGLLNL